MQRQQSVEHMPRDSSWRKTSGNNMLPLHVENLDRERRGYLAANVVGDVSDADADVDAADSDNDFRLGINDEEDMGDEIGGTVVGTESTGELRFCQTHAQSYIVANQQRQFAVERNSVFYDDQLPPIPPGKSSSKALVALRTHQSGDLHNPMVRGKQQQHYRDLSAERSFGFYDADMQDVEIASLVS